MRVEREGAVGLVTLAREERLNALSTALLEELGVRLAALDGDPEVRCIVLAGGERAFAAGADVRELATARREDLVRRGGAWERLRRIETPLVAAVSGHCLGGGCELVLACDVVIASETARFGQPETGLGLVPGGGGTQLLVRAVGKALALDLILTGRILDATEAERAGLVSRVVPPDRWLDEALAVARAIAARAPLAQQLAKAAVLASFEMPLDAGLAQERAAFLLALSTDDAEEGTRAFLEKRAPRFRGR